ncbi:Ig-like domain-containing protein [Hymenobacter sp. 5414T-23]|uniref:Ig-like domain-containing protein n=1 Tax=Hymenobacter sp. 5414T-23 TaxID=2932252 RepID=UPI001FD30D97|nr:hypothetical protein [Hymenobacter sp. 5414T-23]UOQ81383.1 hypothetical protein MUN83_00860 [Hymenobacter sp. 5414T-23]
MANPFKRISLLAYLVSFFWAVTTNGQQTASRVAITSIAPSVFTGQDYSPWLNDDLSSLVSEVWMPINSQYIDVTLKLDRQTNVTQIRLYDYQGVFTDNPASIYALYGTQKVLLGKFTGEKYLEWVTMPVSPAVPADAIIVHKIGNNIPQKVQVYGQATGSLAAPTTIAPTLVQSVINFGVLGTKTIGVAPFELTATSNNTGAPIVFASSNPGVVSVSNSTGKWMATAVGVGAASITASQAANGYFTTATNVVQPITVQPVPVIAPVPTQTNGIARERKLKQQFGVNAFEWDLEDPNRPWEVDATRLPAVKKFNGIRHYLDWERLEAKEGSYTFSPSYNGGWGYDEMYTRLKAEGVEVLACIKTVPTWMLASWPSTERDSENVPVRYGNDFGKPSSYIEQAKLAFQFAARYGSNRNVNPSLLSVNSTPRWTGDGVNQVKIGLNLIQYMECDNERDKWWKGAKANQNPAQYAANLSAYYDGHKNTMGPGVGVKNADPNMQVVMAGLAAPDPNYVKGMIEWCKQNRGYKADGSVNLCWDVINYHVYSNNDNCSQTGTSTRGQAPEISGAAIIGQSFMQMARDYAGSMPVWVTETGFDTNQGSPLKAIAIGNRSIVETQADWTLRTSLMYARLGIERNFFYQLYDDNPGNSQQFATMGLTNADRTPRLATQFLNQANQLLGSIPLKRR